jgi:DNA polymerase
VDTITVDFETYYDKEFSLSKLTTEQYVRSPDFEVIGLGVKVNNEETVWLSGGHNELKTYLHANYDWKNSAVLAHNTLFDGAILSWIFGIQPKLWLDTLCIARALHGVEVGGSLKSLAQMYEVGEKGDEVIHALGKHRDGFSEAELERYGDYCIQDVELAYRLFNIFMSNRKFPKKELKVIDMTLRMFIDPVLELDIDKLEGHLDSLQSQKDRLLEECGIGKDELMSNPKFAKALQALDVIPPTKTSLRTGKETFAFAKSDEGFKALQEHEDPKVQALVAARIGLKSTLEETRTERFIDIGVRGALPVPIKYYAAHTGRWGGSDKINLQNLPSRGDNAKVLKSCILAPKGYTLIQADSAQIEARVLAWLAGQEDLVAAFMKGEDVYRIMASAIYGIPLAEVSSSQRFVGKTTILGAGYGMGATRFREQLKGMKVEIEEEEAARIIRVYRDSNESITNLWRQAQTALSNMYQDYFAELGHKGVLTVVPNLNAIQLPSGLMMYYNKLKAEESEKGLQFSYKTRMGWTRIYGGKVIENVCQGIARCVMSDQMLKIAKRYRVLLTVHDSVVCCVRDEEVDEAATYIDSCMRYTPDWAEGLPVRGDVEIGKNYGDCIEWNPNQHGPSAA